MQGHAVSHLSIAMRIARGLALVPEDRQRDDLVQTMTVGQNLSPASIMTFTRGLFTHPRAEQSLIDRTIRAVTVKTAGGAATIGSLSGGNPQRVVIGRQEGHRGGHPGFPGQCRDQRGGPRQGATCVEQRARGGDGGRTLGARRRRERQRCGVVRHPADNNAATRADGYETVISQYPDLVKVGKEVADGDRTRRYRKMQSLLQANPDFTGVIAGNDEMALGAIAARKEAGKRDAVKVGGFDGSPDAVAAIKAGEMQ